MKKIVILLFVAMVALSAKAQVYVGGTVSLWHNDDVDATTFTLNPEVGYNLNENWTKENTMLSVLLHTPVTLIMKTRLSACSSTAVWASPPKR